jgi:hypothetical protein
MSQADHELELPEQGGANRMFKDLFAGAVGGVAQVLIGQPFDIVKVRLQTTQQYTGALDAATQIYKNEGALAFYKGTLTPLIGIGACVSVQFGGFHYARRAFEAQNTFPTPSTTHQVLSLVLPTLSCPVQSNTSASDYKRNPTAQTVCTTVPLIVCASYLLIKASSPAFTGAQP